MVTVNNIYVTVNVGSCKCGQAEQILAVLKTKARPGEVINIVENVNYVDHDVKND